MYRWFQFPLSVFLVFLAFSEASAASCRGAYSADPHLAQALGACAKNVSAKSARKKVTKKRKTVRRNPQVNRKDAVRRPVVPIRGGVRGGETPPDPSIFSILQMASGVGADITPGSLATIHGRNLSTQSCVVEGGGLPRKLCGIELVFSGPRFRVLSAPLSFVAPGRVDFQIPEELPPGPVVMRIFRNAVQVSGNIELQLATSRFAPFESRERDRRLCTRLPRSDEESRGVTEEIEVTADAPVQYGDTVTCVGTGLGRVHPSVSSGELVQTGEQLRSNRELTLVAKNLRPRQADSMVRGRIHFARRKPRSVGIDEVQFSVPFAERDSLLMGSLQVSLCENEADEHFSSPSQCGPSFALPYRAVPYTTPQIAVPDYSQSISGLRLVCSGDIRKCVELARKDGYPTVRMQQGEVSYLLKSPQKLLKSSDVVQSEQVSVVRTVALPGTSLPMQVVSLRQSEFLLENGADEQCLGAPHPALQELTPAPDEIFVLIPGGELVFENTRVDSEAPLPIPLSRGIFLLNREPCSPGVYSLSHPLGVYSITGIVHPRTRQIVDRVVWPQPYRYLRDPLQSFAQIAKVEPEGIMGGYAIPFFRSALIAFASAPATESLEGVESDVSEQFLLAQDPITPPSLPCFRNQPIKTRSEGNTTVIDIGFDPGSWRATIRDGFLGNPYEAWTVSETFLHEIIEQTVADWQSVLAGFGIQLRLVPATVSAKTNSAVLLNTSTAPSIILQPLPFYDNQIIANSLYSVGGFPSTVNLQSRLVANPQWLPGNIGTVDSYRGILSTVMSHELGHALGVDHDTGLMAASLEEMLSLNQTINQGERLKPTALHAKAAAHAILKSPDARTDCSGSTDLTAPEPLINPAYHTESTLLYPFPGQSCSGAGVYQVATYKKGVSMKGEVTWLKVDFFIISVDCAGIVTVLEEAE